MKVLTTVFCLSLVLATNGQNDLINSNINEKVIWSKHDSISGDKVEGTRSKQITVSKDGVKIIEAQMNAEVGYRKCGCTPQKHGYYIEKYRTGGLKKVGRYFCGRLAGTWIHYYENGQIMKIESFKMPYADYNGNGSYRTINAPFYDEMKYILCREGPYVEFYENGQVRIEGNYEIREVLSNKEIHTDSDTYEVNYESVNTQQWTPKSIKIGVWKEYDENGNVMSYHNYKLNRKTRAPELGLMIRMFDILKIY